VSTAQFVVTLEDITHPGNRYLVHLVGADGNRIAAGERFWCKSRASAISLAWQWNRVPELVAVRDAPAA